MKLRVWETKAVGVCRTEQRRGQSCTGECGRAVEAPLKYLSYVCTRKLPDAGERTNRNDEKEGARHHTGLSTVPLHSSQPGTPFIHRVVL